MRKSWSVAGTGAAGLRGARVTRGYRRRGHRSLLRLQHLGFAILQRLSSSCDFEKFVNDQDI